MINLSKLRAPISPRSGTLESLTHSPDVGDSWARMLFLLPGEDGRDGIVPDRSDDDAGQAGEPPDLVPGKDIARNADVRDRAEGADGIKGEQPPQHRETAQASVSIGE